MDAQEKTGVIIILFGSLYALSSYIQLFFVRYLEFTVTKSAKVLSRMAGNSISEGLNLLTSREDAFAPSSPWVSATIYKGASLLQKPSYYKFYWGHYFYIFRALTNDVNKLFKKLLYLCIKQDTCTVFNCFSDDNTAFSYKRYTVGLESRNRRSANAGS
jgi:hypothetical protein